MSEVIGHRSIEDQLLGTCPFCGFTGKLTREDAIPTWLMQLAFPQGRKAWKGWGVGKGDRSMRSGGRRTKGPIQGHYLKTVTEPRLKTPICGECNNKWLSPVENWAKGRLQPWIRGLAPAPMTLSDRRQLAFWSVKTVLMLDRARRDPQVPIEECRELHASRDRPQGGAHVWIAQRAVRYPGMAFTGGPFGFEDLGIIRLGSKKQSAYVLVFGVHWLEIHVLLFGRRDGRPIEIAKTTARNFLTTLDTSNGPFYRLWPEPADRPLVLSHALGDAPRPRARTPGWPGGWW